MSTTVVPGDRLGHVSECAAGAGTYERQGHIYASLVGQVERVSVGEEGGGVTVTVVRSGDAGVLRLPEVGSVVTGRVTKINARFASVDIVCSQGRPFASSFGGVIRKENVRATEIDRVEVFKSFRPGDIIRAVVLSLGDAKSYYLSTAKINLGVVTAKSEAGAKLVPISWEEMQCELTQGKEHRKVAKPGGVGSIQVSDGRRLMET